MSKEVQLNKVIMEIYDDLHSHMEHFVRLGLIDEAFAALKMEFIVSLETVFICDKLNREHGLQEVFDEIADCIYDMKERRDRELGHQDGIPGGD